MSRAKAITFKGTPLTLAGNEVKDGQAAPDFKLNYFEGGMKEITLADVKGKPTIISVVPSLDTAVCAMQTKKFNDQLAAMGDKVNSFGSWAITFLDCDPTSTLMRISRMSLECSSSKTCVTSSCSATATAAW